MLLGVEFLAEVQVARDDLVEGKDGILDVVAVRVIVEVGAVLPAELGTALEVEEDYVIRWFVDQKAIEVDVAMDYA